MKRYVEAHATKPNWSTVYYSADLCMKGYVPGFIMGILTNSALKSAVSWVKKHSELAWAAEETKVSSKLRLPFSGSNLKGLFGAPPPPPPPPPPPAKKHVSKRVVIVAGTASVIGITTAVSVFRMFSQPIKESDQI